MRKLISLGFNNNDLKIFNYELIDPQKIYLPIALEIKHNGIKNIKFLINDQVEYKNVLLASTVSGSCINITNKVFNEKIVNCYEIINDFKENKNKNTKNQKINDIENLISFLNKYGLNTCCKQLSKKANIIILNCITDEPYINNNNLYLTKYSEEIIETLNKLAQMITTNEIYIVLKDSDNKNIASFLDIIGTYSSMKIKLLNDKYLLERDFFLQEELNLNDSIILKPDQLFQLSYVINYQKVPAKKCITIIIWDTKIAYTIETKLYVSLSEILTRFNILISKTQVVIKNGILNGIEIDHTKEIITYDSVAYYVIKKDNIKEEKCINCGKCYEICPVKINPKYCLVYNIANDNCIKCGLCSYICPSNINLKKYLEGETNE